MDYYYDIDGRYHIGSNPSETPKPQTITWENDMNVSPFMYRTTYSDVFSLDAKSYF